MFIQEELRMNAFTLKNSSNQKQYEKILKQIKEKIDNDNDVTKLTFPYRIFQEVAQRLCDNGFDIVIIEKKTLLGEKNTVKSEVSWENAKGGRKGNIVIKEIEETFLDRPVSVLNDFFERLVDLAEKKENDAKSKK